MIGIGECVFKLAPCYERVSNQHCELFFDTTEQAWMVKESELGSMGTWLYAKTFPEFKDKTSSQPIPLDDGM